VTAAEAEAPPPAATPVVEAAPKGVATEFLAASWVAVVHPRAPLYAISLGSLRAVLRGDIREWSELTGRANGAQPVQLYLPDGDSQRLQEAADLDRLSSAAILVAADAVAERVASDVSAFAVLPAYAISPSVRALIVDGYDPYRDPAALSPLIHRRVVEARTIAEARAHADRLGWLDADALIRGWDPLLVAVTGELIPARCTRPPPADAPGQPGDPDAIFDGTRQLLEGAELALMQLETSLTDAGPPTPCTKTFVLQGDPDIAPAIARAGIDVVLPIGNHIGDCWGGCSFQTAIRDTLDALDAAGLLFVGAGENLEAARAPLHLDVGGERLAILGYDDVGYRPAAADTPGVAPLDLRTLGDDVRAAAEGVDYVIVGFNWGVEYTSVPTERQRAAARLAIESGASLVVGNHPHWVQAIELTGDGLVAYALGNYLFDQEWSQQTTEGAILEASFEGGELVGYRLRPTVVRNRVGSELVHPLEDGAAMLSRVWAATDLLLGSAQAGR
jgi:poly-gamma-glutamate synthesis protein (capsule biosynthesis protein)